MRFDSQQILTVMENELKATDPKLVTSFAALTTNRPRAATHVATWARLRAGAARRACRNRAHYMMCLPFVLVSLAACVVLALL